MTKKKNLDKSQIWTMLIILLPFVILMNLGNELTNDSGMRILYAGIFGGIGALLGGAAFHFTKNKSRIVKVFASILSILISCLIFFSLSSEPTDKEIINQDWITQKIGEIEFDSPSKLTLQVSEIPESAKHFYSEMNLYSDNESDRITSFWQTKILTDTLSIENAFSNALEGMLKKIKVNIEDVEFKTFEADEEEISSMFSFNLGKVKLNGYGFMYMKKNKLECIWLMPIKRGFSKDYIEEFEVGIIPDYK